MSTLVAVLAFASAFFAVLGIATGVRSGATARLSRLRDTAALAAARPRASSSLLLGAERGFERLLIRLGGSEISDGRSGSIRQRLIHAGYRRSSSTAAYYGLRLVLAVGMPAIAVLFPPLWGVRFLTLALILCALTAVGYLAPSFFLDRAVARRQRAIELTLPDGLDLMVVCVEAGFGINQALARVADEFAGKSPVLAAELALVSHETRAGKSMTEALRALSERTGISDVSALVALLVQTERFGTSVADALRVHAGAMRVRRMHRAEERAQLAPLKLILPSTMIFAALLILFLAPSLARMQAAFPNP